MRRVRKKELRELKNIDYPEGIERPRIRADCLMMLRPCPFVTCKYHLYLDVEKTGSIKFNYVDKEPWEIHPSCALDVADKGGLTLEEVGRLLNITRERIRQIESWCCELLSEAPELQEYRPPVRAA